MTEPGDPIEILLVEDNPGDVELTRHTLRAGKICNHLTVVQYGADALAHLQANSGGSARRPRLILLDLNLPDMSGLDILRQVKADPALRTIPVVVLTSSESETDVVRSYDLHAAGYVTKPIDHADFVRAVLRIEDYWLCLVRLLPGNGRAA
jgi:CheY-like chemotaxis protein